MTSTPAADPSPPMAFALSIDQRSYVYDGERWYEERTYQTPPRALLQRLDERLRAQPGYLAHLARRTILRWTELMQARGLDTSSEPGAESRPRSKPQARKPRCSHCGEGLASRVDLQCPTCSWILCACGACGCVSGRK